MIEKIKSPLDLKVANYKGTEFDIIPADTFAMVCRKINEVIDKVNDLEEEAKSNAVTRADHEHKIEGLQKDYDDVCIWVGEQKLKANIGEPTDPYEEQRKWIGCLCRMKPYNWRLFWDYKILERINENNPDLPFVATDGDRYEVCEPVKPDDDIIYKGGDNTRKALDVAVDALKIAKDCCSDYSIECLAHKALEQITALEQKDK